MKSNYRPMYSTALSAVMLFAACSQAAFNSSGKHGTTLPSPASLQRFEPHEDGWQNDPANQPHASDPNPLRRALGDGPILHKLFGRPATGLYLACVKQHAGGEQSGASGDASHCQSLQQDLLQRVHAAGFTDATVDDVFDPHIVH